MQAEQLIDWLDDARRRTLALVADLDDAQLIGPMLPIVNPGLWEIGHVAWFHEKWVERGVRGRPPLRADGDALYDSAAVAHDARWSLPLPARADTLAYLEETHARTSAWLGDRIDDDARYFTMLAVFHEDMHAEALLYTRQTLGYAAPAWLSEPEAESGTGTGTDVSVPGGVVRLGAERGEGRFGADGFVFDNEKWAHPCEVAPFSMARTAVTQAEYARFVDDGGYTRREWWCEAGWRWRAACNAQHPVYWRRGSNGWERRVFDRWRALEPNRPVVHVNWYEANAWCRWAGRRLPTELEWEVASKGAQAACAQLGMQHTGPCDVGAYVASEGVFGCRQMLGGVWEWTASDFMPYPGFERDPYAEYSEPWFGTHKVLRGGCFATQARLIRNTWRNFYTPDRRDVWAGFRSCAVTT
jgi:gamma-glutamyl hercynylcysteine S-oxide synthase